MDWSAIEPEVRPVGSSDNRAGVSRPWLLGYGSAQRGSSFSPRIMEIMTVLDITVSFQDFCPDSPVLEASRLEQAGDLEGAWRYHRAILRSSRQAGMHGGAMQRLIGHSILQKLALRPSHPSLWMTNPKVTPSMLRRAIGDLEECEAMTPPISEMVRARSTLRLAVDARAMPENWRKFGIDSPDDDGVWYYQFSFVKPTERFFQYEPERSLRVLQD